MPGLKDCKFAPFSSPSTAVGIDIDSQQSRSGLKSKYSTSEGVRADGGNERFDDLAIVKLKQALEDMQNAHSDDWAIIKLKRALNFGLRTANIEDFSGKQVGLFVTPFLPEDVPEEFDSVNVLHGQECSFKVYDLPSSRGRSGVIRTDCTTYRGQSGSPLLLKAGGELKLAGALWGREETAIESRHELFLGFWNRRLETVSVAHDMTGLGSTRSVR